MAQTLLDVVNWVRRKTGHKPVTAFSQDNESLDTVQDINDAYEELLSELPDDCPYLMDEGSVSTVNGTATYNLDSDAKIFDLEEWSFVNESDNNTPIEMATFEYIKERYPDYETQTGQPQYAYAKGTGEQISFYPVPDTAYTITYNFKLKFTELSATTDTFLVPDEWLKYIKWRARYFYEDRRSYGNPEATYEEAESHLIQTLVYASKLTGSYIRPSRQF